MSADDEFRAFQQLQTAWNQCLIESLLDAGVDHFVISPGSRSTPLVAALQASEARLTLVTDERSAGFFALGRTKLRGSPTALVCTSGSAAAHYFPAIVEADESCTPLLVLSADRPPELQHNRAFQTIDQLHLFGRKVRSFMDVGIADGHEHAFRALQRKSAQVVAMSLGPRPGPVHLNIPARKPLEPMALTPDVAAQLPFLGSVVGRGRTRASRHLRPALASHADTILELPSLFADAERPALVLGPHPPSRALDLGRLQSFLEASGFVLFAEASSGARFGLASGLSDSTNTGPSGTFEAPIFDGFDLCLRAASPAARALLLPDVVLQIGNPPTSAAWTQSARILERAVITEDGWPDPHNTARCVVHAEPNQVLPALAARLTHTADRARASRDAWTSRLRRANDLAWGSVREACEARTSDEVESGPSTAPGAERFAHEGMPVSVVGRELERGDLLALGNSLPIRLFDTFVPASPRRIICLSQRGANGIDGLVASASGASLAHEGRSILLLGDFSLLHDVGSLALVAKLKPPLTIVTLNNGGGRLFEQLPIANTPLPSGALDAWITPHDFEPWRLAVAFGIPSYRVGTEPDLVLALKRSRENPGPTLIEVRVDPSGTQRAYRALSRRVAAQLEARGN